MSADSLRGYVCCRHGARHTIDWSPFEPLDLDVPRLLVGTTDGYVPDLAEIVAFCLGVHECQ